MSVRRYNILPKSDHSSIHEPREDSTASGQVSHEHESSHKVDRSISTHQRSPSQGHYDEEMENLRASAKTVARTFQQTADEINNGIQEDLTRLKSLLGENMRAQLEIEPGSVELQPRAIPQSDGEEYAPGITYKKYVKLRTMMCGKVTPSKLKPGQPPIRHMTYHTKVEGRFPCPICHRGSNKLQHLESHFTPCAKRNGNPRGLHWFDHPTILEHYRTKKSHRKRLGTE